MNWINVDSIEKTGEIKELSKNHSVLIFKYSPRCIIDYIVRLLFQREWHEATMRMKTYLINVIEYKELSDKIANEFGVEHQSPQILIIENGKCIFSASHGKLKVSEIKQFAN